MRRGGAGKRRDATEPPIISGLGGCGIIVKQLSQRGLPDLLTHCRHLTPTLLRWMEVNGVWMPMEVKVPGGEAPYIQRRRKAQYDLRAIAPFPIVSSLEEALAVYGFPR
jgi:hypothetical protein